MGPSRDVRGQGLSFKGEGTGSRYMEDVIRATQHSHVPQHIPRYAVWCRLVVKICIGEENNPPYSFECLAETPGIKEINKRKINRSLLTCILMFTWERPREKRVTPGGGLELKPKCHLQLKAKGRKVWGRPVLGW